MIREVNRCNAMLLTVRSSFTLINQLCQKHLPTSKFFVASGSALLFRQFMGTNSSNMTQPVIVNPKDKATASLIFLHGLGDTGHGWSELLKDLSLKNIRCICPHAQPRPVTLNGGMVMPAWYDIKGLSPNSPEDEHGIKDASKELQGLIENEVKSGIPAERVFIGGFSQGGSVALYTAFGTNTKLGGVVALSSWMPLNKYFNDDSTSKYNLHIPALQCHGKSDQMVPFLWGHATSALIKKFNHTGDFIFKSYNNLGHSSSPEEMNDVKEFLEDKLKES